VLVIAYLFERQRTVHHLKQQVLEEMDRNMELRLQASADLLHTMPNIDYFWDRLTMEYRRAMTMERQLSLLLVKAKSRPNATQETDPTAALGDAARAMSRKLRPTDSIYRLAPDFFGLVLPDTDTLNAKRIAARLQEELQTVRTKHGCSFDINVHNYPEHVKSSHELEEIVKSQLSEKEDWAAVTAIT